MVWTGNLISKTNRSFFACVSVALLGWTVPGALVTYGPADYVQDGLVVLLDGVVNSGWDKPHDSSATAWANLADTANPAEIVASSTSGWTAEGGYRFEGGVCYAKLKKAAPAMTTATFEFAADVKASEQISNQAWPRYISDGDGRDHNIHSYGKESLLRFKSFEWTGNANDWNGHAAEHPGRAQIPNWQGRQASFVFAENVLQSYEDGQLRQSVARQKAEKDAIPSTRWMVGNKGQNADQQLVGTMNCVRLYNRALSPEEVAHNGRIDAARFSGVPMVTNALIATALTGAEGLEVSGAYAVDGVHVFTVPSCVRMNGKTYIPTGYTCARWNGTAWGETETRTSFSCRVTDQEKVRIVWQWAETDGRLGGTDAYVQEGLVLHLDGISNDGEGRPHEPDAVRWVNLADRSNPACLKFSETSGWRRGCGYRFEGAVSFARTAKPLPAMTTATFEIASEISAEEQTATWVRYFSPHNGTDLGIHSYQKQTMLRFKSEAWTGNATGWAGDYTANPSRAQIPSWKGRQASFVFAEKDLISYEAGEKRQQASRTSAAADSIPSTPWMIDCLQNDSAQQLVGTMKSVRLYNRALTADEVKANAAVDQIRFGETRPDQGAVIVTSRADGLSGRERAGTYLARGWPFTAGRIVTDKGFTYDPAGYVIEQWDAATETWRIVETSDTASSWRSPAQEDFSTCRLSWKWRLVSGLRTAASYDVGDYVQAGLIVHLDGIRNVGADKPHDPESAVWRDLSYRASYADVVASETSGWRNGSGYEFCGGACYAYVKSAVSPGENVSIEIAGDVDPAKQTASAARLVSFDMGPNDVDKHDMMVYVTKPSASDPSPCRWKVENWSGNNWQHRANISAPWDGKYAAFTMDGKTLVSYKKGCADMSFPRVLPQAIPPVFWMVGSQYGRHTAVGTHQLVGTVKALRVYNRALSAEEVAWNHKVDVARFDGALTVTNVVVAPGADARFDAAMREAPGAYEVTGEWTFTAADVPEGADGGRRISGYTLETWENGAWGGAG